jgi:hypothetical protein
MAMAAIGATGAEIAQAASSPAVSTGSATSIKQTSAVLNGKINPEGSRTTYYFRWGPTTLYGATSTARALAAGTSTVSVHVTAAGLLPGTVYHYQLIATNGVGTSLGKDRTFKTAGHAPPNPITGPATVTGKTSVTLTGLVNTEGQSTEWFFRWGVTTSYGAQTPVATAHASTSVVPVSATVTGLAQGTTFHYELVAFHPGSVLRFGGDQTFTTFPVNRVKAGFRAKLVPRHARTKPFLYTVSGSVLPRGFPPGRTGCYGTVLIHFMFGHKVVASALTTVQPTCTYSSLFKFTHLIKHKPRKLWVWVHFRGNDYLTPSTRWKRARLG